jgi:hypothetical protein
VTACWAAQGPKKPSNVVIRGVSPMGLGLRPQAKLVAGRMFKAGSSGIIVGSSITKGFSGTQIGDHLRFAQHDWTVVGTFDAGGSGFDSEIWGDVDQLMQSFRRTSYSSMVVRLARTNLFDRFIFILTPANVVKTLAFSVAMGLIGASCDACCAHEHRRCAGCTLKAGDSCNRFMPPSP